MRREPVTEESVAEARALAREEPGTGLPVLAQCLLEFGWHVDRERPSARIPFFEEAAAIYRDLLAGGSEEHLAAAMHAISCLGLHYSSAHADDRSLAAKTEAAALARKLNRHRQDGSKEVKILGAFAHGLAEAGRFERAVAAQREVVAIYRATEGPAGHPSPDGVVWSLLNLAIYLDLAGRTDASLEIEREALRLKRRMVAAEPRRRTGLVIWLAGVSHRFADTGHPQEAGELLDEAVAACDLLPPEGDFGNFGFNQGVQAALFARSGARDERATDDRAVPIGVSPDPQALQPVLGVSFDWWSFSVRQAYRAGCEAMDDAISTTGDLSALDPTRLAELGTLLRRRNIRRSVVFDCVPQQFIEKVVPALGESVALERRLATARPDISRRRLIRSLTDQAMGHLATGANSTAAEALREAHDLFGFGQDRLARRSHGG
ncbi:tetratricopeptide repeat protein [Streptomyces sp. NPDC127066]|uniref:tetratricopeptide repeat protein n=1 Tax=Streptomyces sp. NPDC127066 TaxID=3347125 RepID=UPI00364CD780